MCSQFFVAHQEILYIPHPFNLYRISSPKRMSFCLHSSSFVDVIPLLIDVAAGELPQSFFSSSQLSTIVTRSYPIFDNFFSLALVSLMFGKLSDNVLVLSSVNYQSQLNIFFFYHFCSFFRVEFDQVYFSIFSSIPVLGHDFK